MACTDLFGAVYIALMLAFRSGISYSSDMKRLFPVPGSVGHRGFETGELMPAPKPGFDAHLQLLLDGGEYVRAAEFADMAVEVSRLWGIPVSEVTVGVTTASVECVYPLDGANSLVNPAGSGTTEIVSIGDVGQEVDKDILALTSGNKLRPEPSGVIDMMGGPHTRRARSTAAMIALALLGATLSPDAVAAKPRPKTAGTALKGRTSTTKQKPAPTTTTVVPSTTTAPVATTTVVTTTTAPVATTPAPLVVEAVPNRPIYQLTKDISERGGAVSFIAPSYKLLNDRTVGLTLNTFVSCQADDPRPLLAGTSPIGVEMIARGGLDPADYGTYFTAQKSNGDSIVNFSWRMFTKSTLDKTGQPIDMARVIANIIAGSNFKDICSPNFQLPAIFKPASPELVAKVSTEIGESMRVSEQFVRKFGGASFSALQIYTGDWFSSPDPKVPSILTRGSTAFVDMACSSVSPGKSVKGIGGQRDYVTDRILSNSGVTGMTTDVGGGGVYMDGSTLAKFSTLQSFGSLDPSVVNQNIWDIVKALNPQTACSRSFS
jgi:hypothetical protein